MNFYSIIVDLTPLYNFSWSSRSINTSWSNPHCPHESNTTHLTDYIWILFQSLWHWVSTVSCLLDVEWTIARFWWSLLFLSAFMFQAYQQEESGAKVKDIAPMLHQLTEWWVLIHIDLDYMIRLITYKGNVMCTSTYTPPLLPSPMSPSVKCDFLFFWGGVGAFLMTAACRAYLAWYIENFSTTPTPFPCFFQLVTSLAQATLI